jgi:hypothetical protein
MPRKRGRPVLRDTDDPVILQRRQRAADRVRQHRRNRQLVAAIAQQTLPQSQQAEDIADRPFEEIEVAQTLAGLGLRVQGVTLAQDTIDAQLQQDAVHVEEHEALYHEGDPTGIEDQPTLLERRHSPIISTHTDDTPHNQLDLTRYFHTLPSRSPFASAIAGPLVNSALENTPAIQQTSPPIVDDPPRFTPDDDDLYFTADESADDEATVERDEVIRVGLGEIDTAQVVVIDGEDPANYVHDSDEETSVYSFASERSAHTGDEDESVEISAHDYTVQKLYDQLQGGFHGCSVEQHEEKLHEHIEAVGEDHHGLNDIFNDPSFPSVLALPDLISADRLARQRAPTPSQWQAIFCGIPRGQQHPMNVCLHKEETQAVEPQVAFDIDSFLGFASSLAMARQGLWYQPAPKMRQNMTTDMHIETTIYQEGGDSEQTPRSSLAMLRDVPHFLLGRVVGAHDITVHVLFPHLVQARDEFVCLTKDQLSRWLDKVFHPAVYRYCEAHYTQHLPASYRHALANSKAPQVEGRQVETATYQGQQSIGYHLQPEYLGEIWTEILDTVANTPGLADFRDPQLFFSAKGTKLQFKTSPSRPTMLDAMENFEEYFERVIDLDFVYLDRFYVDVGKEICPRVSLLPSQRRHVGDEAQVYSWKRCCLERYIHWMYDEQPPAANSRGQRYFDQNMLYDASSLTSVTPKASKLREGGIIYSQFYGSVKEVADATKCKPFDNDGLEELALDPQIRQGARQVAGGHRRDAKIIERAYCASKQRARDALTDSRKKSFGIREEHRITWPAFQGLIDRLRVESRDELEVVLEDCPSYAWAVKTEVYLHYLWRSADKFATGFEVVLARSRQDLVTWEQTKMMAMFLRCLRFVFGGHQLQRESALWWSRRERMVGEPPRQRLWYGLGFCNTLRRYKYCWVEPRIDWRGLTFQSQVTDNILFGNGMLRGQYLRRGGLVQGFFDATRRLELALEWMDEHHEDGRIRDRLILWMVHICLQQLRVDVLSSIKREVLEEHREKAVEGMEPFCFEYLSEIMADGVYLMSGNRCDFKQVSMVGDFLFDFDDGLVRGHWEDRPFRKLYRRGLTGLRIRHGGEGLGGMFSRRLKRNLYEHHWVLPYPCSEVLMQTTKQGKRMWYSICASEMGWRWGRKGWQAGLPRRVPRYVSWSKEEWVGWIGRVGGVV